MTRRPNWDEYFLLIAEAVATRAECTRRQVGAVVVKDRRIRSTGYNGAPARKPSCLDGACPRGNSDVPAFSSYDTGAGTCIALHAEQNALMFAARDDREGATLYLTCKPCAGCWRTIQGSGIDIVTYRVDQWIVSVFSDTAYDDLS